MASRDTQTHKDEPHHKGIEGLQTIPGAVSLLGMHNGIMDDDLFEEFSAEFEEKKPSQK